MTHSSNHRPNSASALSLTVIILTRDEAHHLPRCIESLRGIAERIVVVDSGSTDGTQDLARQHGAEVFERGWINYADQFQWALGHTRIDTDWVMRLDADEWFGSDLVAALVEKVPQMAQGTTGISLDRRHVFMGRWIKRGGRFPLRLLRLWRTGVGRIEQRWMDEHIVLSSGEMTHIDGQFCDENLGDLSFFTKKHDGYAVREAIDILIAKHELADGASASLQSTAQANAKRGAKLSFYNRLPIGVGPLFYFLYRYFIQLGFLDGKAGLVYHVLQGFWYRFLVDAKRFELERVLAQYSTSEERIAGLTRATGHNVAVFLDQSAQAGTDG